MPCASLVDRIQIAIDAIRAILLKKHTKESELRDVSDKLTTVLDEWIMLAGKIEKFARTPSLINLLIRDEQTLIHNTGIRISLLVGGHARPLKCIHPMNLKAALQQLIDMQSYVQ